MNKETKKLIQDSVKTGIKLSFAISYWFVFGIMILIGWIGKGAGLGITMFILSALGYLVIVKMTKFFIKIGQKKEKVVL
jgi:hypothetical protein